MVFEKSLQKIQIFLSFFASQNSIKILKIANINKNNRIVLVLHKVNIKKGHPLRGCP